ncbi:MAG: ABC-type transport auxiliary lipoprotein family protein [Planctomycetota bacterium]
MRTSVAIAAGLLLSMACGCGAVAVPEDFAYRLPAPQPRDDANFIGGVLRVGDVDVVAELAGDRLLVADAGTRLRAWQHHRWAGPLERMVSDALVTGLARTRRFAEVKSPSASGTEDFVITARVLDFHEVGDAQGWRARATIELHLVRQDGRLVFQDEFRADTPLASSDPGELACGLGHSIGTILDALIDRCDREGLFTVAAPSR